MKKYIDVRETFLFFGLVALGYGLYLERPSLAFIVDGSILTLISIFGIARGNSQ